MTSGKASREAREAKAAARRAAAQRAESRRKNSIRLAVGLVVLLVVVGFGALIQSQRSGSNSTGGTPAGTAGAANQSIVVGDPAAPVTVVLYEDLQCPVCQAYERANGPALAKFIANKTVRVEYRPIAILDNYSTTSYSTRALNAVACVRNAKPDVFEKFHSLMFENQPPEQTAGLTDQKITELAAQAGADGVQSCIKDQTFKGWTARVTDQASKDKVNGTPTIFVNGTSVGFRDELAPAIEAAAKAKGAPSATTSPTGAPTTSPTGAPTTSPASTPSAS